MSVFNDLKNEVASQIMELSGDNSVLPENEPEAARALRRVGCGWIRHPNKQFQPIQSQVQAGVLDVFDLSGPVPHIVDINTMQQRVNQETSPSPGGYSGLLELARLV